jgi:hypothetical protein
MDHRVFDTFARRAATALDRRSALGIVSGAVLAIAIGQNDTEAKKDPNKKRERRERQQERREKRIKKHEAKCRAMANSCQGLSASYCDSTYHCPHPDEPACGDNAACKAERAGCCSLYAECIDNENHSSCHCNESAGNACLFNTHY